MKLQCTMVILWCLLKYRHSIVLNEISYIISEAQSDSHSADDDDRNTAFGIFFSFASFMYCILALLLWYVFGRKDSRVSVLYTDREVNS